MKYIPPTVKEVTASTPLASSGGTSPNLTIQQSNASQSGYLSAADWTTFNSKLSASLSNYITNPDAEVDVSDWNLYNNSGRADEAFYVEQDITWEAVAAGNAGNGINISYVFHASQSYLTPLVTVVNPLLITIAWYNGPTLANNPTSLQIKSAFDAVPAAVAIATCNITGIASDLQYMTGSHVLAEGGDTAPTNGTGGVVPGGVTFTRSLVDPLVGDASFELSKDANDRIGMGVSTDFITNSADKGNELQVSFYYSGSANFVFGSNSSARIYLYDITNATMIPLNRKTLTGPTAGSIYRFAATFTASATSVSYRLIVHFSTSSALAYNLKFDQVVASSVIDATTAVQVPSVVLLSQPISGTVTSGMAVAWTDGAAQWVPATSAFNGDFWGMFGMAGNIVGSFADITIRGKFSENLSFGPFAGYNMFVDPAITGSLTPFPVPNTDRYLIMGKAISATELNVQPFCGQNLITAKGRLLSNSGLNAGAGDQNLSVGANGNVLVANSTQTLGLQWAPAVVAAAPFTYTLATRTLTIATATAAVTGVLTGANFTTFNNKAPTATPTFTGNINSSTGSVLISTIGQGLSVKSGANAKIGQAVLIGGTITVANTSVTANSRIFLTSQVDGGTPGFLRVSAKVNATSFTITSSSATDTSTVAWSIIESIP